jgi:hypothetical protein
MCQKFPSIHFLCLKGQKHNPQQIHWGHNFIHFPSIMELKECKNGLDLAPTHPTPFNSAYYQNVASFLNKEFPPTSTPTILRVNPIPFQLVFLLNHGIILRPVPLWPMMRAGPIPSLPFPISLT